MLAIVGTLYLDSVVCKMNHVVLAVVEDVFLASSSKIPFLAEVYFHVLVNQYPDPYIELPVVDEIRPLDVLLDNKAHILLNLQRARKLLQVVL